MIRRLLPVAALLALAACQTPGVNSDGTPTTAAEQVAGGLYGAYLAADGAYLTAVLAKKVTPAQEAAIEPKRIAAKAALDAFAAASPHSTNAQALQAAAQIAVDALTKAVLAQGIAVKGN